MPNRPAHSLVASLLLLAFLALGTVSLGHAVTHADRGDCAVCTAVSSTPVVLAVAAILTMVTATTAAPRRLAPLPATRSHHAPPPLRGPPLPR